MARVKSLWHFLQESEKESSKYCLVPLHGILNYLLFCVLTLNLHMQFKTIICLIHLQLYVWICNLNFLLITEKRQKYEGNFLFKITADALRMKIASLNASSMLQLKSHVSSNKLT